MTELTQQRKEWSATYLLNVLKAICREAYACHFQQGERDSDPCGQCANCKADKMLGANWRTVEAGRSSLESHDLIGITRAALDQLCNEKKALESENAQIREELDEESCAHLETIDDRDSMEDALQKAHIALGSDGEWTCKFPPAHYPPGCTGDLRLDVPHIAATIFEEAQEAQKRAETAESENERLREQLEDAQAEIERLRGPIE